MERHGVRILAQATATRVATQDGRRVVTVQRDGGTEQIAAAELLVAVGRSPNVEGLGLSEAGVSYDPAGVRVDDRLRTSNPRVYAVGDICSAHKFTHAADAQARLAPLVDELRFLLISGDVALRSGGTGEAIRVIATPTDKPKCVRCWHHQSSVGDSAEHPQLCARCVTNVEGEGEERQWF